MLYVTDLQGTELPQLFIDCLPTHCDSCGSHTEITESLTLLRCSNPNCGEKSVQRLVTLLKDLGVKNMGDSKCRQFLENFGVTNPYAIFMYEPTDGPLFEGCSMEFSEAFYEQLDAKRKMLLWEYVKIGNLPGIRDSARKLFSDYDDLEEFFDDLEAGGIDFVQDLLDIKKGSKKSSEESAFDFFEDEEGSEKLSVRAVQVYDTLITHKEELLEAIDYVELKQLTTEVINICISTSVGQPYSSKQDFVSKMNEEFGHKVHLNFLGSVTKDCNFLIWSKEGSPTSKVKKAKAINEKQLDKGEEELVQIMTGIEFREYLASL